MVNTYKGPVKSNDILGLLHQFLAAQKLSVMSSRSQPVAFIKRTPRDSRLYIQDVHARSLLWVRKYHCMSNSISKTRFRWTITAYITLVISHLKVFPGLHAALTTDAPAAERCWHTLNSTPSHHEAFPVLRVICTMTYSESVGMNLRFWNAYKMWKAWIVLNLKVLRGKNKI